MSSYCCPTTIDNTRSIKEEDHHFDELPLERAVKEIACATTASFLVSPMVSMIDKTIVQDISGSGEFWRAMGTAAKEIMVDLHCMLPLYCLYICIILTMHMLNRFSSLFTLYLIKIFELSLLYTK